LEKLHDNDWMSPLWVDELKETFSDVPGRNIEVIYALRLKEKVDILPRRLLQNVLDEQNAMPADRRNLVLQGIIREKLGLNEES